MFLTFLKSENIDIETTNGNGMVLFRLHHCYNKNEDVLVLFNQTELCQVVIHESGIGILYVLHYC